MGSVTLARVEKRNALSVAMLREITACLRAWGGDESVVVGVVAGEGGCFCAGLDRAEMTSDDGEMQRRTYEASRAFHRALVGFTKPLIAVVEGHALGTGFDLALLCDVRLAAEGTQFGHPEIKLGGVPLFTPLKAVVGDGWARELCLSGRSIDAGVAERIGLVNHVVPAGELAALADELARAMAEAPVKALVATKAFSRTHPDPETWLIPEHDRVFEAGLTIGSHRRAD